MNPSNLSNITPRQRYNLLNVVHQTLYGQAYLAVDNVTSEKMVVKISYKALVGTGQALTGVKVLENPVKECEIMRKLKPHKNIIPLTEEMVDENFHWMATPFCSGGDFYDLLKRNGKFVPKVARRYFKQLVAGVEHIHRAGFAHLDISLENLLLDNRDNLVICDFGLAQALPAKGSYVPLGEHRPGKRLYMAPEVHHGKKMDPRKADTYTMGVVLYMMLVGHTLYSKPDLSSARFVLLQNEGIRELLKRDQIKLPKHAVDLLDGLLQTDPQKRFGLEEIKASKWLH